MESETMLESGDDPNTVAAALRNIETARAKLNAKPLGVTTSSIERVTNGCRNSYEDPHCRE